MKNSNQTPESRVRHLNLKPVIEQLVERKKQHGWSRTQVLDISELYRMFLILCAKYPKRRLVPTYEVDAFWHQHILNTKLYAKHSQLIFGKFLHHYPHDARPAKGKRHVDIDRHMAATLALVKKEFYS